MKCPFCSEEIQDAALKCRFCGEILDQNRFEAARASSTASGANTGETSLPVVAESYPLTAKWRDIWREEQSQKPPVAAHHRQQIFRHHPPRWEEKPGDKESRSSTGIVFLILSGLVLGVLLLLSIPYFPRASLKELLSLPKTPNAQGQSSQKVDPNPVGVWIAGDRNSVYNRLVVRSSGSFSLWTVDFTGDVKGGFSGRWSMSGSNVEFEWGGIADHGSASGYKVRPDSLFFNGTVFTR